VITTATTEQDYNTDIEDLNAFHLLLRDDAQSFCKHALSGFEPHKGQLEVLKADLHKQKSLVVAGRRLGKSYSMARKCCFDLFRFQGFKILIINPSEEQSDIIFDDVCNLFEYSPYLSKYVKSKRKGNTLYVHDGPNKSIIKIVKVGMDASRARGKGTKYGYTIFDEINAHFSPEKISDICEPFYLDGENSGIVYMSSPSEASEDNFFYQTYLDYSEQEKIALDEGRNPRHRVYTYTAYDQNHIPQWKIEEARRKYEKQGRLWFFNREYLGQFNKAEGCYFSEKDIRQCIVPDLKKGGRLDSYIWAFDPGLRRSPSCLIISRFNQALSRLDVIDVRSFIHEDKYKPNDGHESIKEWQQIEDIWVDLRAKYPPKQCYVDPLCEKSLTERLRNTYKFPVVDVLIGGYNQKIQLLGDLQRCLQEQKIAFNDQRVINQLLRFSPPLNPNTNRVEFGDKDQDFIICCSMACRWFGDMEITPFAVGLGSRKIW